MYAHERGLTGTFEFRAEGANATVLVQKGQPAKVRLGAPAHFLGEVLVELGLIDKQVREASTKESGDAHKLHGALLVEKKLLSAAELGNALRAQVVRKLAHLARLPAGATFEFYSEWDGLGSFGAEPTPVDALGAVWAAVREQPSADHMKAALDRVAQGKLRLAAHAQIDRFGFGADERRWLDLLRIRPLRLDDLIRGAETNERAARLVVYCLAITKQLEILPADEPSAPTTGGTGPSPESPRAAVARVALKRERVRTGPIEEDTQSRMKLPDRRTSDPPPATAPLPLDARRTEIQTRAQIVDKQNYFEMLGVSTEASIEDVKIAYIGLAKTWHPDRLGTGLADVKDACARVFARMSEAHQTLIDEEKRKRYLRLMKEGGETPEQQQEIANVLGATVEFQKAEIFLRKNDVAQATEHAKKALELDGQQADYVALVAWLTSLSAASQSADATAKLIEELDRALKINVRCERAYFYRAMLYKKQHRDGLALRDFKKVAELNPKNIDAQRELRLYGMRKDAPSQPAPSKPGLFQKLFKK